MTNIKTVLATFKVEGLGFPAIQDLSKYSLNKYGKNGGDTVVISTLSPSILKEQGVTSYFAPKFERGQVFKTAEEIIEANVPLNYYSIVDVNKDEHLEKVIVSRHQGTVDILLQELGKHTPVLSSIASTDDIKEKHVIGTLPPHLVVECALYTPVTIQNFDYNKDGDLQGDELVERIQIGEPISLKEEYHSLPAFENLDDIKNFFSSENVEGYYCQSQEVEFGGGDGSYTDLELLEAVKMFDYDDVQVLNFSELRLRYSISVLSLTKDNKTILLKTTS